MDHEHGMDIDVSKLSPQTTADLAVAFEQMAAISRQAGDEAAEGLLVGLSSLLDEHGRRLCESTGTAPAARVAISPAPAAGVVNAGGLSVAQSLRAAYLLNEVGREAYKKCESLGLFFGGLAQAVSDIAAQKIATATGAKSGTESGSIH